MAIGKASRYPSAKQENAWLDEVSTKSLHQLREVGHDHPRFGLLSRMLAFNLMDVLPSDLEKRVRDENKKQIESSGEPLNGRQMLKYVFDYYRDNQTIVENTMTETFHALKWLGDDRIQEIVRTWDRMEPVWRGMTESQKAECLLKRLIKSKKLEDVV